MILVSKYRIYNCFITTKKRYMRNIPTFFYIKITSVFAVVANERPWVRHTTCCAMPSAVISFASSRAACYSTSNSSHLHATASAFLRSFTFRAFKVASLFWTAIAGAPRWPLMEYAISLLALISVIILVYSRTWLPYTISYPSDILHIHFHPQLDDFSMIAISVFQLFSHKDIPTIATIL